MVLVRRVGSYVDIQLNSFGMVGLRVQLHDMQHDPDTAPHGFSHITKHCIGHGQRG